MQDIAKKNVQPDTSAITADDLAAQLLKSAHVTRV
jgi:hypothetical protein